MTTAPDSIERLKGRTQKLLVFLLRCVCDTDADAARKAITSLVNLSHDGDLASAMHKHSVVPRTLDYLRDGTCAHPRLLVMLLANLSQVTCLFATLLSSAL
jgi:hypothetical protein